MPRAYCPKCGAEVPVDEQGQCHVGHQVDLAASAGDEDLAEAARGLEAEFEEQHPDEPEPWVADVDDTASGAYTPPPTGDDGPEAVSRNADEDLDPDERPAATTPDEAPGWEPPSTSPVGTGPQPPPEPAAKPDEPVTQSDTTDTEIGAVDDDFDLDDLEAAVAELEVEDRSSAEPPQDAVTEPPPPMGDVEASADTEPDGPGPMPAATDTEPAEDEGPSEQPPAPAAEAEPATDDEAAEEQPEAPEEYSGPADEEPEPSDEEPEEEPSREVDLSNFTASGDKVGEGGKKRGLFGFGR